jgi:DNA-binding HxlR family transcriptional regulator
MTSAQGTIATQEENGHDPGSCGAREVLDRVGDKWSLYVIKVLGGGTKRFSDLRREVEAITPRMLTVTLRTLERDGLVSRKVYAVVPPRVEYTLTQMGETLVEAVAPLIGWAITHLTEIEKARVAYDRKLGADEDPGSSQ